MQAFLFFYKQISGFNIPFSVLAGLWYYVNDMPFFDGFFFCLPTVGLALSLYFFQQRNANQWGFYYNLGLTKVKLIGISFVIYILLSFVYFSLF
tara:strand:- start:237 stop:518 length:282 start_codon:yes stop_codon:yes gene_type:complete